MTLVSPAFLAQLERLAPPTPTPPPSNPAPGKPPAPTPPPVQIGHTFGKDFQALGAVKGETTITPPEVRLGFQTAAQAGMVDALLSDAINGVKITTFTVPAAPPKPTPPPANPPKLDEGEPAPESAPPVPPTTPKPPAYTVNALMDTLQAAKLVGLGKITVVPGDKGSAGRIDMVATPDRREHLDALLADVIAGYKVNISAPTPPPTPPPAKP